MTEPRLFDPARTTTQVCVVCGARRHPHEERAPACRVDHDRSQYPRRPKDCLNRYDPEHADIGF